MKIALGDLVIDDLTYTARVRGRPLDLTYKEFELLKHLVQHAGQVFTRAQLLQTVWGYDFFGGTRTVDVHVRRVRAKLGVEHHSLIQTVRNVGVQGGGAAPHRHDGPAILSGRTSTPPGGRTRRAPLSVGADSS